MENTIAFYQTCIKRLLSEYESLKTEGTEVKLCFDDDRMCYLVMRVGWFQQYTRIHRCLIHIEICDETVVIQANNTEAPIDTDLIEMGIPKGKICLGFIPEDFRAYTEQHSSERDNIDTTQASTEQAGTTMATHHSSDVVTPITS